MTDQPDTPATAETMSAERAIEEHEAAICPEDVGCAELIASLRARLASLEAERERAGESVIPMEGKGIAWDEPASEGFTYTAAVINERVRRAHAAGMPQTPTGILVEMYCERGMEIKTLRTSLAAAHRRIGELEGDERRKLLVALGEADYTVMGMTRADMEKPLDANDRHSDAEFEAALDVLTERMDALVAFDAAASRSEA